MIHLKTIATEDRDTEKNFKMLSVLLRLCGSFIYSGHIIGFIHLYPTFRTSNTFGLGFSMNVPVYMVDMFETILKSLNSILFVPSAECGLYAFNRSRSIKYLNPSSIILNLSLVCYAHLSA
jgi:hypothetical protein